MRKAIDTCVATRVIAQDDPVQTPIAERAFESDVFISLSVIMETIWLLTSRYRMPRDEVFASIEDMLDLPTVECEQEGLARWALRRYAEGAAIADMIHLISARHQAVFLTFDRDMKREAGENGPVAIEIIG